MKSSLDILKDLIAIESWDTSKPNKDIVDYICNILTEEGVLFSRIKSNKDESKESIVAVYGADELKDIKGGIVLSGHIDTVPANKENWQTNPFVATELDNKLYGRGAIDMKQSIASYIAIIPRLKEIQPSFPVFLTFTYDEETAAQSIEEVCDFMRENNIKPAYALLGEPTDFKAGVASKGYFGYETSITGKATHSSKPSNGINAIYIASHIIAKVEELNQQYCDKGTTLNVGVIKGGKACNIVADNCVFEWEIRSFSNDDVNAITKEMNTFIANMEKSYNGSQISTHTRDKLPAFAKNDVNPLAKISRDILKSEDMIFQGGTEAGFLQELGAETLICGAGALELAHTSAEYLYIPDMDKYDAYVAELIQSLMD